MVTAPFQKCKQHMADGFQILRGIFSALSGILAVGAGLDDFDCRAEKCDDDFADLVVHAIAPFPLR